MAAQMIVDTGVPQRPRYANVRTQVQLGEYPALIPEWYAPISEYDAYFGTTPAYEWDPVTQSDLTNASVTIGQMIEMSFNRYKFILLNENDVFEIISILEELFKEMDMCGGQNDPEVKRFRDMANILYHNLLDERTRIYNRHQIPNPFLNTVMNLLKKLNPM